MKFKGLSISSGAALAPAYLYKPVIINVPSERVTPEQVSAELDRYADGRAAAAKQLAAIHEQLLPDSPDKAAIFQAHLEILNDVAMIEEIQDMIEQTYTNAADAVNTVYSLYADMIGGLDDPLMRERAADLMDVRTRLLCCLLNIQRATLAEIVQPSVVVAHELMPSDTATMDVTKVCAIVTEEGGATSHSAILARSLGIPAVSGMTDILTKVTNGQMLAVNAMDGTVESDPDEEALAHFQEVLKEFQQEQELVKTFLHQEPVMSNGEYVQVCLNIGSDTDQALDLASAADGVGLFRSEFLYMQSSKLPDEEAQTRAYSRVAKLFGERQVIIRTMDIGGDKQIPCLPMEHEANPFLGYRALRLCFDKDDMFQTQLRAILRAAVHGNLAVMFPMVGGMKDLRRAKEALQRAKASLTADGIPFRGDIPVGIMIEIPSVALMAREVAQEVDFASIGTNDLCQYLLAADRMSPQVASYYLPFHPALFRLIGHVQKCFGDANKPLSVCGEMGGDPAAVLGLMSLGMRKFSMNPAAVAPIKRLVRSVQPSQLEEADAIVSQRTTAETLEADLRQLLATILTTDKED